MLNQTSYCGLCTQLLELSRRLNSVKIQPSTGRTVCIGAQFYLLQGYFWRFFCVQYGTEVLQKCMALRATL